MIINIEGRIIVKDFKGAVKLNNLVNQFNKKLLKFATDGCITIKLEGKE